MEARDTLCKIDKSPAGIALAGVFLFYGGLLIIWEQIFLL